MALPEGWVRIRRNWLIPLGYLIARTAIVTHKSGARGAIKQGLVTAPPLDWFTEISTDSESVPTKATTTQVYHLGQYGFTLFEQNLLLEQAGSGERLLELIDWVERAHKRLKMLALLSSGEEPSVQMLHDAHEPAIKKLARILEQTTEANLDLKDIRAHIHRQVPGIIFPQASSLKDLEKLVAAARNINAWLAQYGTFSCRCRALAEI
jgi:hypothetical protein